MSEPFADTYARAYDELYAHKEYEAECAYIEAAVGRYGDGRARRVVDFGCGTGNHALPLARRGYAVTGVDRSAEMVRVAGEKARAAGVGLDLHVGDIRQARVGDAFDVALFMFAVLGYLTDPSDLRAALENARRHLRSGGLLLFDVWYGPAVLAMQPLERARVHESEGTTTIRISQPVHRAERNVVDVRLRLWRLSGSRLTGTADETHSVRYYFIPELADHLAATGFGAPAWTAFPHLDEAPSERSWDLGCIAVAK